MRVISALPFVIFYGQFFLYELITMCCYFFLRCYRNSFIKNDSSEHRNVPSLPHILSFAGLSGGHTNISLNASVENLNGLMNQNSDWKCLFSIFFFFSISSSSLSALTRKHSRRVCENRYCSLPRKIAGSVFVQLTTEIYPLFQNCSSIIFF